MNVEVARQTYIRKKGPAKWQHEQLQSMPHLYACSAQYPEVVHASQFFFFPPLLSRSASIKCSQARKTWNSYNSLETTELLTWQPVL